MNLRRRTALVTDGSRGIGGAIALRPAADGIDILIGCAGDVRSARVAGTIQAPGRPGTAGDTAAMVAFSAGGDAAFINGQQFTVDGGAAI